MSDPIILPDADMTSMRPDMAKRFSAAMLTLGAALLFFVPISGVFFLFAGGLGLTLAATTPAVSTTATGLSSPG